MQQGDASITLSDVDGRMSRIPPDKRAGFINDPERIEWYGRQLTTMLQGLDSFTAVAAGPASDAARTADNLHDDPEEAQPKEIRRLEKQAKAGKDFAEQERRAALTPEHGKEDDAQKAEQEATRPAQKQERLRNKEREF